MKAASLKEIKNELQHLDADSIREMCLRMVRYKKENKELLTYLLFEAHHEQAYIEGVRQELEELFGEVPRGNSYYTKKSLRKILRFMDKQIRYSGLPETELSLRIFFCAKMKAIRVPLPAGTVLANLYQQQVKKMNTILAKLPEDLQADYEAEMTGLV